MVGWCALHCGVCGVCVYHPGAPVFHDALKGWSCCKKRVTDFTEFLNLKGCTTGSHSNVKPPEPEKPKEIIEDTVTEETPKMRAPKPAPKERPPDDEPLVQLKSTVAASLKTQLEKLNISAPEVKQTETVQDGSVAAGTNCHNGGCKASYEGEHSLTEKCVYHPGAPIFHEGMKYWTCCQRKTSDFNAFLDQEGCEIGTHNWTKPKVTEEQQVRMDWYETGASVCISMFAKVAVPEKTVIKANRVLCQVSLAYNGGANAYSKTFKLKDAIIPEKSDIKLLGTKVEINLKKAEAFAWGSLELKE